MEFIKSCQKMKVNEGFELSKLMQTLHAYFTDNKGLFATAFEREGKAFSLYVYSGNHEQLIELCDYIESNKFLKRVVQFDRMKNIPDNCNVVEYRRVRIPSTSKSNADADFILKSTGDKVKSEKARKRRSVMMDEHDNTRFINMKSNSSGHNFMIRVTKEYAKGGKTGGTPDSYGFSGKNHMCLVPDPKDIF